MGQDHMHLLVMQSKRVPCIYKGIGQGHLVKPSNYAKKWADYFPSVFISMQLYLFVVPFVGC